MLSGDDLMSIWLFYALLAPALFGLTNIFDKILTKKFHPETLNVVAGVFTGLAVLALPFVGVELPPAAILLSLFTGAIWFLMGFPYFKAMSIEEPSRIAPLWQLAVPITLVLSAIFLQERLTSSNYIAILFIFIGAFLVSVKDIRKTLQITPAFWLMMLACFLLSLVSVISKHLYTLGDFLNIVIFLLIGNSVAALVFAVLFKNIRKNIVDGIKGSWKMNAFFVLRMLFEITGYVALNLALMTGSVSLTTVLDGLSSFFVFIIATVISVWKPALFKEEVDRKTLLTKTVAIFSIMIGLFILAK